MVQIHDEAEEVTTRAVSEGGQLSLSKYAGKRIEIAILSVDDEAQEGGDE